MNVIPENLFARRINELKKYRYTNDYYQALKSAAILRQLLIDQDALVHTVNRGPRIAIRFKVDNTFTTKLPLNSSIHYTPTELGNMVLRMSLGLQELKLDKFLGLNILEIDGTTFTVLELIKYAANKQGGVHFENATGEALKASLDKLEQFKAPALILVLNTIVEIVLIALRPLVQEILLFPSDSCFFSRYDCSMGQEGASTSFKGDGCMKGDFEAKVRQGFGWFAEIKIDHQKSDGKKFIFQLALKNKLAFSVYISESGGIGCNAQLSDNESITVETDDFRKYNLFQQFFCLACVLIVSDGTARLQLQVNSIPAGVNKCQCKEFTGDVERCVIGADIEQQNNAVFDIKELIILDNELNDEVTRITNLYFERRYRA
ncbi:hypothetical protein [Chryseolinea sp. H1M3-3]|uniref:hypothetical protein n=1 Tax=Chryseolinea sp. H1M3-3 TaxID=3034144 RepID=UPI0023EB41B5|nr:hypothetical protein [Chryseolinea sp. H1M3-3]